MRDGRILVRLDETTLREFGIVAEIRGQLMPELLKKFICDAIREERAGDLMPFRVDDRSAPEVVRAVTGLQSDGHPYLKIEFAEHPAAEVDVFQKRTVVDAGVVVLFPFDSKKGLAGFETIETQINGVDITFSADEDCAATRDPLIVELAQQFLEMTDNGSFQPGIVIYLDERYSGE